jgi:aarF domain-containing kinase
LLLSSRFDQSVLVSFVLIIFIFQALQDKCLVRGNDELEQLFLEDFGVPHTEIFKNFDEEPIAAASLAQVVRSLGLLV